MNLGIPVVVLEGSPLTGAVITLGEKPADSSPDASLKWLNPVQQDVLGALGRSKPYLCPDSSEDLASVVHLLLTVSF